MQSKYLPDLIFILLLLSGCTGPENEDIGSAGLIASPLITFIIIKYVSYLTTSLEESSKLYFNYDGISSYPNTFKISILVAIISFISDLMSAHFNVNIIGYFILILSYGFLYTIPYVLLIPLVISIFFPLRLKRAIVPTTMIIYYISLIFLFFDIIKQSEKMIFINPIFLSWYLPLSIPLFLLFLIIAVMRRRTLPPNLSDEPDGKKPGRGSLKS
jgi:hypothetical protein